MEQPIENQERKEQNINKVEEKASFDGPEMLELRFRWQGTTIDIGHYKKPRTITAGPHPLNDFNIGCEAFGEGNYPLIVPMPGERFGLFLTPAFMGKVTDGKGDLKHISELSYNQPKSKINGYEGFVLPIESNATFSLKLEDLEIDAGMVEAESQEAVMRKQHLDYFMWRITSFSAIAHLALILMFQFVPSGNAALHEKSLKSRFSELIVMPPPTRRAKPKFKLKEPVKRRVIPPKVVRTSKNTKNPEKKSVSKTVDRVKSKGLLGMLTNSMGSAGTGSIFGNVRRDWLPPGKLLGRAAAGGASFGPGLGRCLGTNCTGGDGNGGGSMYGGGGQWGQNKNRKYRRRSIVSTGLRAKKRQIRLKPGTITFKGSLTKAQIAQVVRQNWFMIRHCYERQLQKHPKLSGKIILKWIIAGSGEVQTVAVAQTTMNNERVENCLRLRVLRWRFPQPRGGGLVFIKYPFIFFNAGK